MTQKTTRTEEEKKAEANAKAIQNKKMKVLKEIGEVLKKYDAQILSVVVPEQVVIGGTPYMLSFKSDAVVVLADELPKQDEQGTKKTD